MTPFDLDAIQARADAATPGPWAVTVTGGVDYFGGEGWIQVEVDFADPFETNAGLMLGEHENAESDADFIADAREDVPALVAAVRDRDETLTVVAALLTDALTHWFVASSPMATVTAVEKALQVLRSEARPSLPYFPGAGTGDQRDAEEAP